MVVLSVALHLAKRPNYDRIDNDLKYRYIKMKGESFGRADSYIKEEIFELQSRTTKLSNRADA